MFRVKNAGGRRRFFLEYIARSALKDRPGSSSLTTNFNTLHPRQQRLHQLENSPAVVPEYGGKGGDRLADFNRRQRARQRC
jgi:hypothetical protein